ncbi:hypothetical protein ACWD7C_36365 [Streptomyces sp. NPDC005134]
MTMTTTAMTLTLEQWQAAARVAAETDRQVRRLYHLAYRVGPIGSLLTNPNTSADGVAYATTRIPCALAAAKRLLALPGVADHAETPYALSFLNAAERQLTAPATRLLILANSARAAAVHAQAAGDDLRVVVFRDIERTSRRLVGAADQGWNRNERTLSDTVQRQAEQWGLTGSPDDQSTAPTRPGNPDHPPVSAYIKQEVAHRAATRTRCADGIRCERSSCLAYGAVWVEHGGRRWFLCAGCIPAENADLQARGFDPGIRPVPGGLPAEARFDVYLYNASGRGGKTVACATAQEAQFVAETERPFNNTGFQIQVQYASCPTAWPARP